MRAWQQRFRTGIPGRTRLVRPGLALGFAWAALLAGEVPVLPIRGVSDLSAQDFTLRLVAQSPTVATDGSFVVELIWNGPVDPSYTLGFTAFGQVASEDELREGGGQVLNRWPGPTSAMPGGIPLDSIARSAEGNLLVQLPLRGSSPVDPNRMLVPNAGIYPLVVEIRGPEGPVASVATQLIRLPEEVEKIRAQPVAVLLGIGADGLSVEAAASLLEDHPAMPITVFLDESSVAALQQSSALAERLRVALAGRPVVGPPDLDLDPSALAEIGQGPLYAPVMRRSHERVAALGLLPAAHVLIFDGALTVEGAALLLQSGVTTVVDPTRDVADGGSLATSDGDLAVVPVDVDLTAELREDDFTVARVHRLLAELSLRGGPVVDEKPTPVVLGGPDSGQLSASALDVLFDALEAAGFVEAADVNDALDFGSSVRPDERSTQDLRPLADQIGQVLDELATYQGFYVAGGAAPDDLRGRALAALGRDLEPERRSEALTNIGSELDAAFSVISLPGFQAVTLAAQQSLIPMAIRNDASGGRNVMLRFESDKVEVPADGTVLPVGPGAFSFDIDVVARSVGLSPMDVVILTPDGRRELARSRFQVRSTAVPGLGFLLSGAALGTLALWWSRSILESRRSKLEAPAP